MAGSLTFIVNPGSSSHESGEEIRKHDYEQAYCSFANKAEFTEPDFVHDLTGYYPSLRTYATLQNFDVRPLHSTDDEAEVQLELHWSTVVGFSTSTRDLRVVKKRRSLGTGVGPGERSLAFRHR